MSEGTISVQDYEQWLYAFCLSGCFQGDLVSSEEDVHKKACMPVQLQPQRTNARLLEGHGFEAICADSLDGNHSSRVGESPRAGLQPIASQGALPICTKAQKLAIDPAKIGQAIGSGSKICQHVAKCCWL